MTFFFRRNPLLSGSSLARDSWTRFWLRNCDRIGAHPEILGRPRIVNRGRIQIGDRFRLSSHPVRSHLLAEPGAVIDICDDVFIGHGSSIAARDSIRIGAGSRLGAFVLAMDTDYHVAGDAAAEANVCPIEIGTNVRIGNRVTILRGSWVGDGATISDGSVVSGEIPAGSRVAGVPARAQRVAVHDWDGDGVDERVRRVAQVAFRLRESPELAAGPAEIAAWDSLGALSFLLALEEEFKVSVSEERMRCTRSLSDVASVMAVLVE